MYVSVFGAVYEDSIYMHILCCDSNGLERLVLHVHEWHMRYDLLWNTVGIPKPNGGHNSIDLLLRTS
jgi:hypothetical protein